MEPVNEADLSWTETERGDTAFRRKKLAAAAAGDDDPDLGCSLYELPPGKRSWPYHYHTGNAEAFYVLAGRGQLRTEDDEHRLRPGDYVACPAGEAGAHRVVNDGDEPLRYLALSTMRDPDVTVYPDSGKSASTRARRPAARTSATCRATTTATRPSTTGTARSEIFRPSPRRTPEIRFSNVAYKNIVQLTLMGSAPVVPHV